MEKINYNGVDGVFIPNKEFEYIRETVSKNNVLIKMLVEAVTPDSAFKELERLNFKYL